MIWELASFAILATVPTIDEVASHRFEIPPPSLVEHLRREHHRGDWVRITTDSARFEVRVREIGTQSLSGLSSRRLAPAVPESIPWSSISRLDRVRTSFRTGQVLGFASGGVLGLVTSIGRGSSTGGGIGLVTLGALAGARFGGQLGDRRVREQTLYVGSPAPDSAAPARVLASEPASESASEPDLSAAPPATALVNPTARAGSDPLDSIRIDQALHRLRASQLLRIRGEFGEFEGLAAQADRRGLAGLRPSSREDWNSSWPRELGWDRIQRLDRRGNSAGRGALLGGGAFAGLGLIVGAAGGAVLASTGSGDGNVEVLGGALIGAGISGAIGAGLGWLIGSAIPRWHVVYERR